MVYWWFNVDTHFKNKIFMSVKNEGMKTIHFFYSKSAIDQKESNAEQIRSITFLKEMPMPVDSSGPTGKPMVVHVPRASS